MPTLWRWTVVCRRCGETFTRTAVTRERPDRPRVGEPLYGEDVDARVTTCVLCKDREPRMKQRPTPEQHIHLPPKPSRAKPATGASWWLDAPADGFTDYAERVFDLRPQTCYRRPEPD